MTIIKKTQLLSDLVIIITKITMTSTLTMKLPMTMGITVIMIRIDDDNSYVDTLKILK